MKYKIKIDDIVIACFLYEDDRDLCLEALESEYDNVNFIVIDGE